MSQIYKKNAFLKDFSSKWGFFKPHYFAGVAEKMRVKVLRKFLLFEEGNWQLKELVAYFKLDKKITLDLTINA